MNLKELDKFINNKEILPFIDQLVNLLYTSDINKVIEKKCKTQIDKRVFLMYIIMYFYSYLIIPNEVKKDLYIKESLKKYLSELINNSEKRLKCIEMYQTFENIINANLLNL